MNKKTSHLPRETVLRLTKENAADITKTNIDMEYGSDPWLHNQVLNTWEAATQQIQVQSYPMDISIPFINQCNAKCLFCSYWENDSPFLTSLKHLEKYASIFRLAGYIGINPAGEPLLHPELSILLKHIRATADPRCYTYLVTNGILLHKFIDVISETINSCTISLNAGTQATHDKIMGVRGKLTQVLNNAEKLIKKAQNNNLRLEVYTTFVVLRDNIAEIPAFIKTAEETGFKRIYFRNLATGNQSNPIKPYNNPNYYKIQPHLHPDFKELRNKAQEAIKKAKIDIVAEPEMWAGEVIHPTATKKTKHRLQHRQVFTKGEKQKTCSKEWERLPTEKVPSRCQYLYKYMIDPRISNIQPVCVYMDKLPGYHPMALDPEKIMECRNSQAMIELRRAFAEGTELPKTCGSCNILRNFKEP